MRYKPKKQKLTKYHHFMYKHTKSRQILTKKDTLKNQTRKITINISHLKFFKFINKVTVNCCKQ